MKTEVDTKITYATHKAYKTAANYLKVEPLKETRRFMEKNGSRTTQIEGKNNEQMYHLQLLKSKASASP